MENVYCVYQNEKFLFICHDEIEAQEMVLSLTEEYIYHAFLREVNNCGIDLALWLFRNAPKYGWNQFWYKERKVI